MSLLWSSLRGVIILLLYVLITLIIAIPLVVVSLLKLLLQKTPLRPLLTRMLDEIASAWIGANNSHQRWLLPTTIELTGPSEFDRNRWYMLVVNHQSWVDILVLLRLFNRRLPYWKFFLKTSLLWIPVLGLAFWALDFPYMRRHSKEDIARDPSLAGRDLEMTRRQCERYSKQPVTIISYLEGTRFTEAKHSAQQSPYQHLLIPKAGGMAFTLAAMNGRVQQLLDVTIYYPAGRPTFWDYICGRVARIEVDIKQRPVAADLIGNYSEDENFRRHFQVWVNSLWQQKDALLDVKTQNSSKS